MPREFEPKVFDQLDQRRRVVRERKRLIAELLERTTLKGPLARLYAEQAAFLQIVIETRQVESVDSGKYDHGSMVQQIQTLMKLLRLLGVEGDPEEDPDDKLGRYLEEKSR